MKTGNYLVNRIAALIVIAGLTIIPASAQESPVLKADITTITVDANGDNLLDGGDTPFVPPNESFGPSGTAVFITAQAEGTFTVDSFTYQFFVNGESIGENDVATTNPVTAGWIPPRPGVYFLTVIATDGVNTVTTPTIRYFATGAELTSPLSGTLVPVGSSVTLKANATPQQGSISQIEFFADGVSIGSDNTAPYSLVYTPVAASGATVNITVVATDSNSNTLNGAAVPITMINAIGDIPTVTVAAPSDEAIIAVPTEPISVTITANDADGRIDRVEVYIDGVLFNTDLSFPYTAEWTPVAVGQYLISALAYDDKNNVVASPVNTVHISAPPAVLITGPTSGTTASAGSVLIIEASASDSDGTVESVQFYAGDVFIGEDFSAPFSVPWTVEQVGDTLAVSLGALAIDDLGLSTASSAVTVNVQGSGGSGGGEVIGNPPVGAVTTPSTGTSHAVNSPILLAAEASDSDGNVTKVQFYANGNLIGSDESYPYSFIWTPTSLADYEVEARVTDNDGNVAASAPITLSVVDLSSALPSVSVSSPAAGSNVQTSLPTTIIISASDSDGSVASVQVFVDGQPLGGPDVLAPYSVQWIPASAGNYNITAQATDNAGNINNSATVTVGVVDSSSAAPEVSIVSPSTSETLIVGSSASLIASAVDSDGEIASVQFFVNGRAFGMMDMIQPYSAIWTPTSAGTYTLEAVAVDGSGNQATSSAVTVSVIANGAPSVTLTSPSNGSAVSAGSPLTLVASASDADGTIQIVNFIANGVTVGSDQEAPYTTTWTPGGAINYTISARAIDNSGNVSDSVPVQVSAGSNQAPTVSLASPNSGSSAILGSAVEVQATAIDPDGTIASVEFYANGISIGSVTGSPFTVEWTPVVEGVYVLSARAVDNGGSIANSGLSYFSVSNQSGVGVDLIYKGSYISALDQEQGEFTMVRSGGDTARFYAKSNDGSQVYALENISVDGAGNFELTSGGATQIDGQFANNGAVGFFKQGRALLAGELQVSSPNYSGPSGVSYGSFVGAGDSEINLVSAPSGAVSVYLRSGNTTDLAIGNFRQNGSFSLQSAGGRTVTGMLDPESGFLSGSVTGLGEFSGAVSSAAPVSDGFLRNLSTRGNVGTGDEVLIVGFVVNQGDPKQILVRAVGPTLGDFGVSNAVSDLELSLYNSAGLNIASNDNWNTEPNAGNAASVVGAFTLPNGSMDSALVRTLPPGPYTAQVRGVNGATGVGLVEIYDMDSQTPFSSERILNVSTRGRVGSGDSRLIAGLIINGTTPKRVLVRAVGPTLSTLGVNGSLADPRLRLVEQSTGAIVRENNDWGMGNDSSEVSAVTSQVGAFALPSGSKDAALLITLPPGVYTAIVESGDSSEGIALVEVYEIP